MTKFIKILIIINGLLIPGFLLVMFVTFLIGESRSGDYDPDPVKIENLITRNGDTLMTQGISYDNPESIYNSSNLLIKVSPRTFEDPKLLDLSFESGSYSKMGSTEYCLNLIFLDPEYNVLTILVDKKASITNITIPSYYDSENPDTTVKNIGYLIAFDDSNKDGKIDYEDNYDLWVSDLNGKELTRVTHDIDIRSFEFIKNHKKIFISFTERQDIPEEHKFTRFALYDIKSGQIKFFTHLDKAIISVQKILNN